MPLTDRRGPTALAKVTGGEAPRSFRARRRTVLVSIVGLAAVACSRGPEGSRILEVRASRAVAAPSLGELATLTPAATPTLPSLTLGRSDPLSELHFTKGWTEDEEAFRCSGPVSQVRFWVGEPRPVRVRGRAEVPSLLGDDVVFPLEVRIGRGTLGRVDLAAGPNEFSMEGPPGILRAGTNILTLLRRKASRGDRRRYPLVLNELIIEDGEAPRLNPVRPVELTTEDEPSVKPGLLVDRSGTVAHLLDPPSTADWLEVGIVCRAGGTDSPPRYRVTVESDREREVLLEGVAAGDRLRHHGASLAGFAGAPVRLGLEITGLAPGASCIWVEPRVVDAKGGRAAPPGGGLQVPRANLIVVILDAARRDRFGLYGSQESTTPAIDALARESVVFDRAYTQASYTLASSATLFTGQLPPVHRVTRSNVRPPEVLSPGFPTLSEVLMEAGYSTAMLSGNGNSVRLGLSRGYQEVRGGFRRAEEFRQPVLEWVDQNIERPFFLYVHVVQPHTPYDRAPERFYRDLDPGYRGVFVNPAELRGLRTWRKGELDHADLRRLQRLYEANLRYPDWVVGELVAGLRERGVLERSILVLTSDHGESLGERGTFGHGHGVDRELARIPLLVRLPSRFGLTGRREGPVGNVDLMPTLLELLGARVPEAIEGRSFVDRLKGSPDPSRWPRPVLSWAGGGRATMVAVYGAGFKYRFDDLNGRESLFTAEEEEEGEDLRESRPVSFDYLAFSSYLPDITVPADLAPGEAPPLDAESLEALRELGYAE